MITSYKEYKSYLAIEKPLYLGNRSFIEILILFFGKENTYLTWRYVLHLRRCELLKNSHRGGVLSKTLLLIERRRKNNLGVMLGFEIHENCFEEGLLLYHRNVVVNSKCRCGKNIKFHGMNCIGNKGQSLECPTIGDDVEFGFGASAFGDIQIPDRCMIAANSTVIDTFPPGTMFVAGNPAVMKR